MKKNQLTNRVRWYERAVILVPLILFFCLCIIPFLLMLSGSFTDNDLIKSEGLKFWPQGFNIEAYKMLFQFPDQMVTSYVLTVGVTLAGTLINIFLTLLMSYALADGDYKHRRIISFALYFTILFSPGIVPVYIIVRRILHLYDTFAILVLFNLLSPGLIFSLRVYIQNVPSALYESARMDGASEYRILWSIVVPLVKPGIAIITFNIVIMYWNDSMTPLLFTDNYTPIALYLYRWENYIQYLKLVQMGLLPGVSLNPDMVLPENTVKFAMGVVSSLPLIIIFLFFQKQFIRGLTAGGVKG